MLLRTVQVEVCRHRKDYVSVSDIDGKVLLLQDLLKAALAFDRALVCLILLDWTLELNKCRRAYQKSRPLHIRNVQATAWAEPFETYASNQSTMQQGENQRRARSNTCARQSVVPLWIERYSKVNRARSNTCERQSVVPLWIERSNSRARSNKEFHACWIPQERVHRGRSSTKQCRCKWHKTMSMQVELFVSEIKGHMPTVG